LTLAFATDAHAQIVRDKILEQNNVGATVTHSLSAFKLTAKV
jgi:hypothetical protein